MNDIKILLMDIRIRLIHEGVPQDEINSLLGVFTRRIEDLIELNKEKKIKDRAQW